MILNNTSIKVIGIYELTNQQADVLYFCYATFLKSETLHFYQLLLTSARQYQEVNYDFFQPLIPFVDFNELRIELEKHLLIKTFQEKTRIVIECIAPKTIDEFIEHPILGELFFQTVNEQTASHILGILRYPGYKTNGNNISAVLVLNPSQFSNRSLRLDFRNKIPDAFNLDDFLEQVGPLVVPYQIRTKQNLSLIESLANKYQLSFEQLKGFLLTCLDKSGTQLDRNRLKYVVEKSILNHTKEDQRQTAEQYLVSLQKVPLTQKSLKMIQTMRQKYQFSDDIIILILQSVYEQDPFKLNLNYMEMVCESLHRAKKISLVEIQAYFKEMKTGKASYTKQIRHIHQPQYIHTDEIANEEMVKQAKENLMKKRAKQKENGE